VSTQAFLPRRRKLRDLTLEDVIARARAAGRPLRIVLYLRVSSKRQLNKDFDPDGLSIPAQREACMWKVKELDGLVVEVYIERAETARSAERPELKRMLVRLAEQRDVDVVLVHKLNRWMRSVEDDVLVNIAIREAGAVLVSVTQRFDNTPQGKFTRTMQAAIDQLYSDELSTEVIKGSTQKAKAGGTPHMAPIGYVNVGKVFQGREVRVVVHDKERAPHVVWAWERFAVGDIGVRELTDMLAERGLTSRPSKKCPSQPLSRSYIAAMLHNPYYCGIVTYQGVQYEGRHKPLISRPLFDRVQEVLAAHDQAGERKRVHHHYLKGSLRCNECESRMVVTFSRGKQGDRYPYFFCAGRHRGSGCKQLYVPIDVVEREVERIYRDRELPPDLAADLRAALRRDLASLAADHEGEAKRQRSRLDRLNSERTALLQAHYAGAVPLDQLKAEQDRIAHEKGQAEHALSIAESQFFDVEEAVMLAVELLADCRRLYREASPQRRRDLNQVFFQHFLVDGRTVADGEWSDALGVLMDHPTVRAYRRRRRGSLPANHWTRRYGGLAPAERPDWWPERSPAAVFAGQGSNKDYLAGERGFEPLIG
jgi:site-specific DNA recombinase